ncbi:hypothetical protein Aasi_1441 [Candidatus Amoebophilus asiaticus 5a2]|uniref:Fungal lipase-type domain-containing protein n=1 Tax=Amoebophilus asiaticus (strain 5a2) TaxID=452471 RepID=B3EU29_AMOA5|nr:GTPase RsgA [Candidatus Amoebophilus asiaticus]ACE06731.1 hypothetical protein Aasi_1441 [Candidatus Amoebophilus asiaticus 5a2]
MKEKHNISQQFIARLLLVSLCLQSCGGGFDNNPLIPIEKEPTKSIQAYTQEIIPQTNIQPLVGKTLTAQGGHIVTCYQEDGKLKANIEINAPQGFSKTYEGLSVAVEQGAALANLSRLNTKSQERRIRLQLAQGSQPAKVVIYKGAGLVGGMEGDDEEEPMDEEWIVQEGQVETIEEQEAEGEEDVSLEERNYNQLQTMPSERAKELPIFQKPLNPSKTLQGSQDIYEIEGKRFKCQNVSGEGMDCFFNAAGLEREEQIARLKEYEDNKTVRDMIANEIVSAAKSLHELPEEVKEVINYTLYESRIDPINRLKEERNRQLAVQSVKPEEQDLDKLPSVLQNIDRKEEKELAALRQRASEPKAYMAFVKHHIGNREMMVALHDVQGDNPTNQEANFTSIDAIAYINNLGIKIYQPENGGLRLTHQFIPANATRIVYLYHSGVHFQTLIPFPYKEPSDEVMETENVACHQKRRRPQTDESSVGSPLGELHQQLMDLSLKSQQVGEQLSMEVEEEHNDKLKRNRRLIDDKEEGEKESEKEEVGENRKSYGTLDDDAEDNFVLGKHYYKKGKQEKGIKYLERAKKAGNLEATQYLEQIQLQQLQNSLKVPEIASKVFTSIDQINCKQIELKIHAIDSNIKRNKNTEAKISGPELDTERQELQEKLEGIQKVAKDVSKSDEWEKNATVPMVKSEDELKCLAERAVNTVYQKLNKSNNETAGNGSSLSPSSEAFSSQTFGIDKEIQPQIRMDKKIEEMNTFLSTIAHKNETSFTKTKQEELYEEINTFLSTIAHKHESSFTEEEQKKLYNVSLFLQKEMEEISNIAYGEEKKPLIVLLGNTGAGKSTIVHWLTGKKMFSIKDFTIASSKQGDNKFHYIFSDTQNNTPDVSSKIAPGKKSKTSMPELWPDPEGWVYADCPGFNDTRGTLQKIKNALYIQALLKHHNRVKFLFVMPAGIFDSSVNRVKDVADALANLKNMFKDPYKLKNNISLVVTHHIADFHKCIKTIKEDLKEFADVKKDEALKALLNDLAERRNGITLFSRPLELGLYQNQNNEEEPESISSLTTHDQSLLKQNNKEKALVLKSIKSSDFLSLNFDEDVDPSIPDDAKLLLRKMSANLVERLKELLKKHIAEKIRIYFNEKIRNFKASVDALVDKCMQYYTPMALVFGPSKKAKEDLEETLNKNAISHNEKSVTLQVPSSWIAGAQLTSGVIGTLLQTTGGLLTASEVTRAFFQTTGAVLAASEAMPIALLGAVASISVYYIRKNMWRDEVRKHFIEREAERIKLKLYDFAIKLKKLNRDIFKNDLLKDRDFLNKINSAPSDISEIEKTAGLLDCICGISDNDGNDCKHLLSQTIWNDVFSRVNEHIVKRFFQTPYDFYKDVSAPDQMEQIPPSYVKYFTEKIKNNNKLSHIPEDFLNNLLTNYLKNPGAPQNFSLAEFPIYPKKLYKIIDLIQFCQHIYTDFTTRDFVTKQEAPSIKRKRRRIIDNKNEIDSLYSNLLEIRDNWRAVSNQPAIYVSQGKYSSIPIPFPSREAQRPKFQADYIECINQINIFLQETLKRDPINHKNLGNIELARRELKEVQDEIHMEFSLLFNHKQIDASIPPFIDTTDKNKEYPLKAEGVIADSFLHKTQLSSNSNIFVLDVGFRNLEDLKGIFNDFRTGIVKYKENSLAWFPELGEVDYVAYIERGNALKQGKDKLVIVYSGSNSAKDWNTNVRIGYTPLLNLSVHQGIGELFTKSAPTYCNLLIDKINHYYEKNTKPKKFKIITTGHSLGGALALLAAYHYKTEQIPHLYDKLDIDENSISVKTFIFGAPAIADESSQKSIEKVLGKNNIFRIWTIDDPVVYLSEKLKWHVGTSFPLCNISNNKFNILDIWGPHLAKRYLSYLLALKKPFISELHKELTSILEENKTIEMITMLRDGSLRIELPKSGEISIKADITSEGAGPSLSQNFEGTTTSNLLVSSSEREQEISCPEV